MSSPTSVVGTGSAASCTESSLRAAVAAGGVITFSCGSAKTTIAITQPLVAPWDKDTTLDGGDLVTLDGQHQTQILRAYRDHFRNNDRMLAVQRLTMTRGRDVGTDFVPRAGDATCAWGYKSGGGGAIYTRDVNLRIWGVTFDNNLGPELGPDVAGGAVYVVGSKSLTINHSSFTNNGAANGGAVGLLHASAEVHNTTFENNRATGWLANFANASGCPYFNHEEQGGAGGLGGAFYSDGSSTNDIFRNVTMVNNTANDMGGAVFRSAYWGLIAGMPKQTYTWQNTVMRGNRSNTGGGAAYINNAQLIAQQLVLDGNDSGPGDGGALKMTGMTVSMSGITVSNNRASWGGGIAHWSGGVEGVGTANAVSYAGNAPNNAVGVFPSP